MLIELRVERNIGDAQLAFLHLHLPEPTERRAFLKFYERRLSTLAAPSCLIPRLRETDYRLLESTTKLRKYVGQVLDISFTRSIPLGRFHQTLLDLMPRPEMLELLDGRSRCQEMSEHDGHGTLAPLTYFCVTKCRVEDGSGRLNPGVSGA